MTAVVPFDKVVLYLGDDAVHKFELKTQEIETRADKTANMKKFAELLASMPPANAAQAILEMMNNRESNFAIQLLHHMEPRNASKVLAEIGDAQMVYQIAAGFRAAPVMR